MQFLPRAAGTFQRSATMQAAPAPAMSQLRQEIYILPSLPVLKSRPPSGDR
jgi:hypothetical protein